MHVTLDRDSEIYVYIPSYIYAMQQGILLKAFVCYVMESKKSCNTICKRSREQKKTRLSKSSSLLCISKYYSEQLGIRIPKPVYILVQMCPWNKAMLKATTIMAADVTLTAVEARSDPSWSELTAETVKCWGSTKELFAELFKEETREFQQDFRSDLPLRRRAAQKLVVQSFEKLETVLQLFIKGFLDVLKESFSDALKIFQYLNVVFWIQLLSLLWMGNHFKF